MYPPEESEEPSTPEVKKPPKKDRDYRYTGNHSGAENTGEAASDRTAALADPGTFHSRSRIAVSWMVDRSKKKKTVPRL